MFEFIYLHLGTPLKVINRNIAPKRCERYAPYNYNEEPSSNLIKSPVVFGKPKVPSNFYPEECPPNKSGTEPEPEAIKDRCIYCGHAGAMRCFWFLQMFWGQTSRQRLP